MALSCPVPDQPGSILIIKPGSFGDVIHGFPCASALKEFYPSCRITWLIDERWSPLVENHPAIDDVVAFPRQRFRGLGGKLRSIPWAMALDRLKPDLVIDLQGLLRSALMAKCSKPARIVGLSDAREGATWFYDDVAQVVPGEHSVRRYLRTLEVLGLPPVDSPKFQLPSGLPPGGLSIGSPFVLLHPFARGSGKSLSVPQVVELCRALAPMKVLVAGMGQLTESLPGNAVDGLNKTSIQEMIWLIRQAAFVISVDSGPMHIAAALDTPLLSLHTWSDPRLVGPFNESAWIWQGGQIQHQNLSAETLLPAKNPDLADIREIGTFVRSLLAGH